MGGVLAVFPRKKIQQCLDRKMVENRNSDKIKAVNHKSVEVANILKYLVMLMHFEFFPPFISTGFATSMLSHLWLLDGHSQTRNPEDLIRTPQKPQNSPPIKTLQLLQVKRIAPCLLLQLLRPNQEASTDDGESCPSMEERHVQRCRKKANRIITDPWQPSGRLFQLPTSAQRYCSIRTRTARVR